MSAEDERVTREIACRLASGNRYHIAEDGAAPVTPGQKFVCRHCGDIYAVGEGHLIGDVPIYVRAWPYDRKKR